MSRRKPLAFLIALAVLAPASLAAAHVSGSTAAQVGSVPVVEPGTDPFTVGPEPPIVVAGPCTDASAAQQYPDGEGHDHLAIEQHEASCRMRQQAFLSLKEELASDAGTADDEVLGEMDVENDIAAVAIAYPRGGILFFDVSDPAQPKFLRRYNGPACEGTAIDVDCGAFVDLSDDGKTAFLSVQQISVIPGVNTGGIADPARPGVQVVDVDSGALTAEQPVPSVGGVHTSRDHIVPEGPSSAEAPRAPGHYLFSVANGMGVRVSRVIDAPTGGKRLEDVGLIEMDEIHDMFIQEDPLTGRTLLYIAAGFDTGFYVYDVTDPALAIGANQQLLAEWDLTPQCREDWYSHTIDVATRDGRRIVTLPAEAFVSGDQSEDDQAEGCGATAGNGDKAGPLWIVDATDFDKLGRGSFADALDGDGEATEEALKAASSQTLISTWTNAADRPAQNINFTPHNQQIVGDRIYLSGYHSGITVLDAKAAFAGRNERPREVGFIVPTGTPTRPIYSQAAPPASPFFTAFINFRPLVWDMVAYKGSVVAADMTGGFYSFSQPPREPVAAPESEPCRARDVRFPRPSVTTRSDGGLRLRLRPRPGSGATRVVLLRHSRGSAVVRARRVAAATLRYGAKVLTDRRLADGFYSVVFRARGSEIARVALRRSDGRFTKRPPYTRRRPCSDIRRFTLSGPVFGGSYARPLTISYRVAGPGRVRLTAAAGATRRTLVSSRAEAGRTYRLTLPAAGLADGRHRFRLRFSRAGARTSTQLTAVRIR